jgi:hypothetical protein
MGKGDGPIGRFGGRHSPYRARAWSWSTRIAAAVFLLSFFFPLAEADSAPPSRERRILIVDAGDDSVSTRMTAELGALGFEVRTVQRSRATAGDSDIELLSRTIEALATIGVDRASGEVRVWTVDRTSGRIVLRAVVAIEQDPAVVALRAVEALRTSLHEVESPSPTDAGTARTSIARDVDRPAPTVEPRGPPSLDVSLGPALAGSGGISGVSWQALLSLHWLLRPRWGIEAVGIAPLGRATWKESEGSASLIFGLVAAGVHWRPLAMHWCTLDLGGGIGAALIHTEGSPNAGFFGRNHDTPVATPLVNIGYAVSVVRSLWLRADVVGAVAIPRPVFAFADRIAGSWGQPLVLGSLGIEIVLR